MRKIPRKRKIEHRLIDSLTAYPVQGNLFTDLSDGELEELAADIEKSGLNNSVEILTDGTIICGHQRVRAAKLLGRKKIRCWVRVDLEEAGDTAIEERFIRDNLNRRQLSKLGVARCYRRLKKNESNGLYREEDLKGDLRDCLAKKFDVSGRTLDRLAAMLDAPREVQDAFESGKLSQKAVLEIIKLAEEEQLEIAKQIASGEEPNTVFASFSHVVQKQPPELFTLVSRFVRALDKGHAELKDRVKEITPNDWDSKLRVLRKAERLLDQLINRMEKETQKYKTIVRGINRTN